MDSIEEKLIASFAEKFGGQPKLSDNLTFIGVDSVGMAELTLELERDYGIHVDETVLDVETVEELANYIRIRQSPL
ncbi:MAG: acyl carrier protein [Planctomycetales bacterium]|nr:acyl carrier protein [Planctomycetales bacterium]